jgi:YkoY family integral membrane protein
MSSLCRPLDRDSIERFAHGKVRSFVPIDITLADLVTIGMLVLLEGLLSADNALVLAILVLGLPREQQARALRYGIVGAFVFRIIAILLASVLMQVAWVKLVGGLYLGYLAWAHFARPHGGSRTDVPKATAAFGLTAFWATVARVELVDVAFSVDSILVAVALSPKLWVVVTGGLLGIVMMRLVAGRMIELIRRYPALVDGAFIIIAWVAVKLVAEYAHNIHLVEWQIPKSVSLGLIAVIFTVSYLYARKHPAVLDDEKAPAAPGEPADRAS